MTMSSLFAKVAFYPTLTYTVLMSKLSSRRWYDRIDEAVLIGALPTKGVVNQLVVEENVHAIVSVTEDFEINQIGFKKQELKDLGIEQLVLRTVDFTGTPSQKKIEEAIKFILHHRTQGHSVYVHCKAGRTRSATVVTCYLCQLNDWSPEEAVDFLQSKRPHIWIRDKQWKTIKQFCHLLHVKTSTIS